MVSKVLLASSGSMGACVEAPEGTWEPCFHLMSMSGFTRVFLKSQGFSIGRWHAQLACSLFVAHEMNG